MKFGVCIGDDYKKISLAEKAGADYVESCFALLTGDDEKYEKFAAELENCGMKCEAVNCFIPGELKVTGDEVDDKALWDYIEKGMKKAEKLGIKKIVFGSGGSRRYPEGYSYEKAIRQICHFLKEIVAPLANKYNLTVVIEPLSKKDTNIIGSVKEGAMLCAFTNEKNIRLLADLFHTDKAGDKNEDIAKLGEFIRHAHIAEPVERRYPASKDEYDYKSFIEALETAGCETCSVEAGCDDFAKEVVTAISTLKSL